MPVDNPEEFYDETWKLFMKDLEEIVFGKPFLVNYLIEKDKAIKGDSRACISDAMQIL